MKSPVCRVVWSSVLILAVSVVLLPGLLAAQPAQQVADINTAPTGNAADFIFRSGFVNLGGTILFTADDGRNGMELWRTDGSAAGTVLVGDICHGACASRPAWMTVAGS